MRPRAIQALLLPFAVTGALFGRKVDIPAAPNVCQEGSVGTVLGTMTWGGQTNLSDAEAQLRTALAALPKPLELDSARMYVSGGTEKLLGDLLGGKAADVKSQVLVATKANPFATHNLNLSAESVRSQLSESLEALELKDVDIFYLHAPDRDTPLPETLAAVQKLYKQGRFREFGLSNYPAWQVVQIWAYMASRGWVTPTVYQGMYGIRWYQGSRAAHRALNMRFYAYNPLAGGLLTGRYKGLDDLEGDEVTRFSGAGYGEWYGVMYQNRFWKPSYFEAIATVEKAAAPFSISMVDAALRWLYHHSQLNGSAGDKVIIGGSKTSHLEQNLEAVSAGPLPQDVVTAWEAAWEIAKADCPPYFR